MFSFIILRARRMNNKWSFDLYDSFNDSISGSDYEISSIIKKRELKLL